MTTNRMPVSLTLIPPSPVTDKVEVDIRAAIWNRSAHEVTANVQFYLDRIKPERMLRAVRVVIPARSSTGTGFRWPTRKQAGGHEIILVVQVGGKTVRTARPLNVLPSRMRSTGRINGAWAGIVHWSEREGMRWNSDIRYLTDAQWREVIRGMHEVEMDIVVIQESFRNEMYHGYNNIATRGYPGQALYPSRLFPTRMPIGAKDPIEAMMAEADRHGMYVFAGVGLYAWRDYGADSLAWHKRVATELWERYGHHRSFYGWYLSEEMLDGVTGEGCHNARQVKAYHREVIGFFKEFQRHCRSLAPDKPIMLAPGCFYMTRAGRTWRKIVEHCDILSPFAFNRMPKDDVSGPELAVWLQKLCDETGSHLWMDIEVFLFNFRGQLIPRPIKEIEKEIKRLPVFEKIVCYQYPGLMCAPWASVKLGGPEAVQLFRDYKRYLSRLNAKG